MCLFACYVSVRFFHSALLVQEILDLYKNMHSAQPLYVHISYNVYAY